MSRNKLTALCSLALGALSASAASAASPAWWVEGKPLTAKITRATAEETKVTTAFVIKSALFDVECNSVQLPKSFIEGEKRGESTS